jgi:hypothetical protein
MDSVSGALRYLFIYLPFKLVDKFMEWVGIIYGMLEYPFHQGKAKAQKVYKNISNG